MIRPPNVSDPPCLRTVGLTYSYPGQPPVLTDVTIRVPRGAIYGFLGPNGAGKTTTLRLIIGLIRRQHGSIELFGERLEANRIEILRRVGCLIESPSLYEHLTAAENLRVVQPVYGVASSRIGEVLHLVGLGSVGGKLVGRFSLGMKQRLAIALALLHGPELLILDEPTNGLDPNGIVEMRDLLRRLNREAGVTILISSHLLAEIERLADHIGILHRGRLLFEGTLDGLRRKGGAAAPGLLQTSDDARALEVLGPHLGARREGDRIILPPLAPEGLARLNRRLVEHDLDVHAIGSAAPDLESIFMDMVSH